MLTIRGLRGGYGSVDVLQGVDLEVAAGEVVAVIGSNGAGKTTLLRAISGLLPECSGEIRLDGTDLRALRPDRIVRAGVVHVPEGRLVLGRMTVRENLALGGYVRRTDPRLAADLDAVLALFPRLEERLSQPAGTLSGGEQQMLAIGRGLMGGPRLLMLDEPSLGIAPRLVEAIFEAIDTIRARGVTILLVEQNASRALAAAARGYVLELGRVAATGPSGTLLGDERVRRAYLGL